MAEPFDISTMPEEKFMEFIRGLKEPPQKPVDQLPIAVDAETRKAMDAATQVLNLKVDRNYVSPEGEKMGIRPGVFLDISKGAGAGVRWKMGLDENQINQFKMLNERFGVGNVDLSDDGRF